MKTSTGVVVLGVAALLAGSARAADVDVRSTTFLGGRPDVVDGQVHSVVPITQVVGLSARRIENPVVDDLSVSLDAWGSYEIGRDLNALEGDVNIANVEGRLLEKRLRLRLGRQVLFGGAARLLIFDGLFAEYRLPKGFGAQAYVGMPVAKRFGNVLHGDLVVGGRAFWAPSFTTEMGASIIHVTDGALVARQDAGLDARLRLHKTVAVKGAALWSLAEGRLAELDVGPQWQPSDRLELLADYRRTAPDLLLPRSSILSVFADTTRDDVGVSGNWSPLSKLGLFAEARMLWLQGEPGYDAGLRGTWRLDRAFATTVNAQVRRLHIPDNGYWLARVAGRKTFGELSVSLDLEGYFLDQAVHGQTQSYSAMGNVFWRFAPAWQAGVSGFAAVTPTYESRFEVLAKLVYTFVHEAPRAVE